MKEPMKLVEWLSQWADSLKNYPVFYLFDFDLTLTDEFTNGDPLWHERIDAFLAKYPTCHDVPAELMQKDIPIPDFLKLKTFIEENRYTGIFGVISKGRNVERIKRFLKFFGFAEEQCFIQGIYTELDKKAPDLIASNDINAKLLQQFNQVELEKMVDGWLQDAVVSDLKKESKATNDENIKVYRQELLAKWGITEENKMCFMQNLGEVLPESYRNHLKSQLEKKVLHFAAGAAGKNLHIANIMACYLAEYAMPKDLPLLMVMIDDSKDNSEAVAYHTNLFEQLQIEQPHQIETVFAVKGRGGYFEALQTTKTQLQKSAPKEGHPYLLGRQRLREALKKQLLDKERQTLDWGVVASDLVPAVLNNQPYDGLLSDVLNAIFNEIKRLILDKASYYSMENSVGRHEAIKQDQTQFIAAFLQALKPHMQGRFSLLIPAIIATAKQHPLFGNEEAQKALTEVTAAAQLGKSDKESRRPRSNFFGDKTQDDAFLELAKQKEKNAAKMCLQHIANASLKVYLATALAPKKASYEVLAFPENQLLSIENIVNCLGHLSCVNLNQKGHGADFIVFNQQFCSAYRQSSDWQELIVKIEQNYEQCNIHEKAAYFFLYPAQTLQPTQLKQFKQFTEELEQLQSLTPSWRLALRLRYGALALADAIKNNAENVEQLTTDFKNLISQQRSAQTHSTRADDYAFPWPLIDLAEVELPLDLTKIPYYGLDLSKADLSKAKLDESLAVQCVFTDTQLPLSMTNAQFTLGKWQQYQITNPATSASKQDVATRLVAYLLTTENWLKAQNKSSAKPEDVIPVENMFNPENFSQLSDEQRQSIRDIFLTHDCEQICRSEIEVDFQNKKTQVKFNNNTLQAWFQNISKAYPDDPSWREVLIKIQFCRIQLKDSDLNLVRNCRELLTMRANKEPKDLLNLQKFKAPPGCNLSNFRFETVDLSESTFGEPMSKVLLDNCSFVGSNLRATNLVECKGNQVTIKKCEIAQLKLPRENKDWAIENNTITLTEKITQEALIKILRAMLLLPKQYKVLEQGQFFTEENFKILHSIIKALPDIEKADELLRVLKEIKNHFYPAKFSYWKKTSTRVMEKKFIELQNGKEALDYVIALAAQKQKVFESNPPLEESKEAPIV